MRGRELAALALACALGALGACKSVNPLVGPPPQPQPKPYVIPADATFIVVTSEAVDGPEQDVPSYTKVYIDGKPAGQTPEDAKSKEKKWGDVIEPGNHLVRFEQWTLPLGGGWTPMAAQWQPPERFLRVEPGRRLTVTLKFFDNGRRFSSQLSREPLGSKP